MSLTSHINNLESPVRQFMEAKFPNNRLIQKVARPTIVNYAPATIRPMDVLPYGTIGMALDYRIRYYFDNTEYTRSVAFGGASILHPNLLQDCIRLLKTSSAWKQEPGITTKEWARFKRGEENAVVLFFVNLSKTIDTLKPAGKRLSLEDEGNLCRHCVILALYEEILRAGSRIQSPLFQVEEDTLNNLLAIPADHWIDDLCTLSWAFHDNFQYLLKCEQVVLNPGFHGSGNVGGADADMILDNCLIDIKTTMNPSLDKLWLYQLLGYVLLDYRDIYEIRSVAILYARQGFLLRWELKDLLADMCGNTEPPDLVKLRNEFQHMIGKERDEQLGQFNKVKVFDGINSSI
jgi:hypothetical protein